MNARHILGTVMVSLGVVAAALVQWAIAAPCNLVYVLGAGCGQYSNRCAADTDCHAVTSAPCRFGGPWYNTVQYADTVFRGTCAPHIDPLHICQQFPCYVCVIYRYNVPQGEGCEDYNPACTDFHRFDTVNCS